MVNANPVPAFPAKDCFGGIPRQLQMIRPTVSPSVLVTVSRWGL